MLCLFFYYFWEILLLVMPFPQAPACVQFLCGCHISWRPLLSSVASASLKSRLCRHSLFELQVRWDRSQSLGQSTDQNVANKLFSAPSVLRNGTGNQATSFWSHCAILGGIRVSRSAVKFPTILNVIFFLMGHLLGCCRSLTGFQSSCKVILVRL